MNSFYRGVALQRELIFMRISAVPLCQILSHVANLCSDLLTVQISGFVNQITTSAFQLLLAKFSVSRTSHRKSNSYYLSSIFIEIYQILDHMWSVALVIQIRTWKIITCKEEIT